VSTLSTAPAETGRYLKIEQWLASNAGLIVAVSLLAAFALRLTTALGTFLNPDEALHYLLVNQTSLGDAYRASLTNAHPPLYFVLLYYWCFAGSSEIMLRLPSVLAGTAACWMAFRWIAMVLGRTAGVAALLLMALSPTLMALGAQVRAYSVFLFWMAAALYFLERAFRDQRVSSVVYF
jgi:predicted membrane-bound mannosyltransferase